MHVSMHVKDGVAVRELKAGEEQKSPRFVGKELGGTGIAGDGNGDNEEGTGIAREIAADVEDKKTGIAGCSRDTSNAVADEVGFNMHAVMHVKDMVAEGEGTADDEDSLLRSNCGIATDGANFESASEEEVSARVLTAHKTPQMTRK